MSMNTSKGETAATPAETKLADLPHDVLAIIFGKIDPIDILSRAQLVCRSWRRVSFDPRIWKVINIDGAMHFRSRDEAKLYAEKMAREAVDRSQGKVEELRIRYFGSDDLMSYTADRTSVLRCLHLIGTEEISEEGLSEALGRFPLLEKLNISYGSLGIKGCMFAAQACPRLKTFRCIEGGGWFSSSMNKNEALGLTELMPEMRSLQLFGIGLSNNGVLEILDKCAHLECLDIRNCGNVNMAVLDESIRAKCARIKNLRLPNIPVVESSLACGTDTVEAVRFDTIRPHSRPHSRRGGSRTRAKGIKRATNRGHRQSGGVAQSSQQPKGAGLVSVGAVFFISFICMISVSGHWRTSTC